MNKLAEKVQDKLEKKVKVEKSADGGVSITKKGILGDETLEVGASGIKASKEGLLSSSSASVGADGVHTKKEGLISTECK